MSKTTSLKVLKFAPGVHHFHSHEDYQRYYKHRPSIKELLRFAPNGDIKIEITRHLLGVYYTYKIVSVS